MMFISQCKELENKMNNIIQFKDTLMITSSGEFIYVTKHSNNYFRRICWFNSTLFRLSIVPDQYMLWSIG